MEESVLLLQLATNNALRVLKVEDITAFVKDYLLHLRRRRSDLLREIREAESVDDALYEKIQADFSDYVSIWKRNA